MSFGVRLKKLEAEFVLTSPKESASAKTKNRYSAPRRFNLATVMVATTAYAMLLAGLKALDFGQTVLIYAASLVTLVAVAQSLFASWQSPKRFLFLFSNDPRQISVLVGILFAPTINPNFTARLFWNLLQNGPSLDSLVRVGTAIILPGTLMGYLSGVLVAGVFLVADYLHRFLERPRSDLEADQHSSSVSPLDD